MTCALIVAAGSGKRMGPGVDKLFLEIAGRPVIAHTWLRFDAARCIHHVVVVVRDGQQPAFRELGAALPLEKPWQLVVGGKERQDSVWNGLEALPMAAEFVAVQDGARPCVTEALIAATVRAAQETGAAVAAQPVTDTIKESADATTISRHLDRSVVWAVQTPQTFRVPILRRALGLVRERGLQVTDDTAACELIGQPVRLVHSSTPNPKVTSPQDLPLVESVLRSTSTAEG